MGTPGPVGFEPGMFKKDSEEHKAKSDSSNKVCTLPINNSKDPAVALTYRIDKGSIFFDGRQSLPMCSRLFFNPSALAIVSFTHI